MIAEIMKKMIADSHGSLHDIDHFIKVHSYAKTIVELEGVDADTLFILEAAAIVHDIACPGLRERFGRCDGKAQEREGMPLARELLAEFKLAPAQLDRIVFLVGHHHTPDEVDGIDYRILLEADYIVNAGESGCSRENIKNARDRLFETDAGREILADIYGV